MRRKSQFTKRVEGKGAEILDIESLNQSGDHLLLDFLVN
jgi:hypothetical protein